jgi:hypothetical protein
MDERERLRAAGFSEQEIDAYLKKSQPPRPAGQQTPVTSKPGAAMIGFASGAIPGAETMGGVISALTGGTFEGGRRSIAQAQREAKELLGTTKYTASEIAGMVGGASKLPAAALKTLPLRMASFGGMGAVRGASRAGLDEEETPTAGQVATSALKGAAAEAAGVAAGERVIGPLIQRFPGAAATARMAKEGTDVVRRGIADVLESPAVQSRLGKTTGDLTRQAARFVEPVDLQKIQRVTRQELRPTGETTAKYSQQASELKEQADRAAKFGGRAIKAEQQRVRQQAQDMLDAAKARLQETLPGVTQGPANARALQQSLRAEQVAAGDASYELVRQLGATPDVNLLVEPLQAALKNPGMRQAYNDAINKTGASAQRVALQVGKKEKEFLIPGLDGLDAMRTSIRDKFTAMIAQDKTGAARTQMTNLMREVDALEKEYLDALPKEAGDALKAARAEYRAYFERLEGLQDGLNLSRFGTGKQAKLVGPNRRELAELEKKLRASSPEAQEAFKVGAADWVNNVISQSPDDALRVANAFVGTAEKARRTRLALGDEATDRLMNVFSEVSAATRATRATSRAVSSGGGLMGELPIQAQAREAARLAKQIGAAERGLSATDKEAGAAFADVFAPSMTPQAMRQARGVAASVIDREIADMTPQQAIARLTQLQRNPAVKKMFGAEIDRAMQTLTGATMRGTLTRASLGALLAGGQVR